MADLKTKLLEGSKKEGFERLFYECEHRVKRIRQRNDMLQKSAGTEEEEQIAQQISRQRDEMEADITELRDLIKKAEERYTDLEHRKKLKAVRAEATKQFERNRVIMREYIDRSFMLVEKHVKEQAAESLHQRKSVKGSDKETGEYDNPKTGRKSILRDNNTESEETPNRPSPANRKAANLEDHSSRPATSKNPDQAPPVHEYQEDQFEEMEIDYELHQKLERDKVLLLRKAEADLIVMHDIIQDIAVEVDDQGQNLNIISEELMRANENAVQANAHMDEANELQRKSRKRTTCIVMSLLVLVIMAVGVIVIVKVV